MRDMGLQPDIRPSGGGTDGNVFRLHGIESVVVGMSTNLMHTIDEYVVVPDLLNTARFCEELMTFRCLIPPTGDWSAPSDAGEVRPISEASVNLRRRSC